MMKKPCKLYMLLLLIVACTEVWAKELPSNVLGIRINMSKEMSHRRLQRLGHLVREEPGRQEVWKLEKEPHFASVLIGYDQDNEVRYVTAIAREGGTRILYGSIGNLRKAYAEKTPVHSTYTWEVEARGKSPAYFVIVMGRDPQYLTSLSLKKNSSEDE
jgi:hypothetical protein